jgi:hypothetical protein
MKGIDTVDCTFTLWPSFFLLGDEDAGLFSATVCGCPNVFMLSGQHAS